MKRRGNVDAVADFAAHITGVDPRSYMDEDAHGEFLDLSDKRYRRAVLEQAIAAEGEPDESN